MLSDQWLYGIPLCVWEFASDRADIYPSIDTEYFHPMMVRQPVMPVMLDIEIIEYRQGRFATETCFDTSVRLKEKRQ